MGLSPSVALVIAITIGLPILACFAIMVFTPGVNGALVTHSVVTAAILAFVVGAIFEIRHLADRG